MNQQSVASVVRQIVAVAASIYGVLASSVSSLHLPPAIAAILTAAGPLVIAVEHFVADPSTGTAAQAVKVIDATPEVNKLVADAKTELLRIVDAAKVFVVPPQAPLEPPVTAPVAPHLVMPTVAT